MTTSNPYRKLAAQKRPAAPQTAKRSGVEVAPKTRLASKKDESLFEASGKFNPQSYDHGKTAGTNRRMFDKSGQINAVDRKDAMVQISHLLNEVTKKNAGNLQMRKATDESKITKEARRDILAAALSGSTDSEGFRVVGQELALPIKAILDYEGFARKIYRVRKLAQAELFRIPLDIRSTAWVIGQDGQTPESRIKTKWITPSEFKITSFPSVDIMDIYHYNFDVLDRAQDTARQEIELAEDKAGLALIDRASTVENDAVLFGTLGVSAFEDIRYQVERHRLIVENFMINRQELSDIVKTMSTQVDMVTERELLLAGYIGTFMNAQILTAAGTGVEEVVPAGTVYAVTGADYMGEMGVRVELFSESYNKYAMQETVKGFAFCEILGFGIPNSRACAKGTK
jgi:hypothetical protein